jgi:diaminopimelate decarboxylase
MLTHDGRGAVFGGVALDDIFRSGVAKTPAYVYDLDAITEGARALAEGFGEATHLIAYAVKANSAGPIVRALARAGCGAEVVSGGELAVALASGIAPDDVLYSGVGKLDAEIDQAILAGDRGIFALQMESIDEIARVEARARALERRARVSFRVNPSVLAETHVGVATGHDEAKFGVARADLTAAVEALSRAPHLDLVGLSCHVGSQLTQTDEYLAAAEILIGIAASLQASRPPLAFIDFGGGFGVDYGAGCKASPADFARGATRLLDRSTLRGTRLVVEPGRALVAPHGVLCASVISAKVATTPAGALRWLVVDAGMNDLVRPAMYGARHRVEPMDRPASPKAPLYRVVGPVCESSDDFGAHPFEAVPERVILRDAGAYGFTMASEYNGRALPTEVFLRGGAVVAVSAPATVDAWVARRVGIEERG